MSSADNTAPKQRGVPFKSGQSGNPAGRPKGARNKLSEEFFTDLYASWQEHGKAAIEEMREQRPHEFVRMIASLVPKDFNMNQNDDGLTELSDEQLLRRLKVLSEQASDLLDELDVEPDHSIN